MMRGIRERRNMQSWSEERWNEMRAVYYGMCARLDHQFGLLMDALREADIYDDTAAFFFADHGVFAGSYGLVEKAQNVFPDCLTNVPLVVKPPASAAVKPRVSDALVELIDISATVEAFTGVGPSHAHFGRSLLPVLAGETDAHRDSVFCEGGRLRGETHCSEGGTGRESFYWPKVAMQVSEGGEHGKAVMLRTRDLKYVYRLYETDELYDLRRDPGELHNVIADPRYKENLAAMKERMLRFMVETADVVPHELDSR
jgi:arylsulfatase A-like enzyme